MQLKLLSYGCSVLDKNECGEWWWDGAPVLSTEHQIKIYYNGSRIPFSEQTGEFNIHLDSQQDLKMGILEISIFVKGLFSNDLIGYAFKRIEEFTSNTKEPVYYLKILPNRDPISGWLCCRECKKPGFKPPSMAMFLAISARVKKSTLVPYKANAYTVSIAKFLTGEEVTGQLLTLKEIYIFLFRDIRDLSELIYSGRELLGYYKYMDNLDFKKLPPYPYLEQKPMLWERLKRQLFRPDELDPDKRSIYAKYLLDVLPTSPYAWHVESEEFYLHHLKNYRYAIAPYGQAFLSVHAMLNVIQKKIAKCICSPCKNKTIGAEAKFFHAFTGIPYHDILHDDSKYLEYVMFVEKETQTLYITFKGTMYSREALIDVDCKYHKYKNGLYHKGIFQESQQFFNNKRAAILAHMQTYQLTKIRTVGQSLGAALATLVCMFMKESTEFTAYQTSSIGYSPPPVVNKPSIFKKWDTDDWDNSISSVVYGNDIVPTLCLGKIFELRLLITHLYTISIHRYKNKTVYLRQILKRIKKTGKSKLLIPGRIYKIRHTRTSPGVFLVKRTHWSEYSAIRLSSKAIIHHTPGVMLNALKKSLKYFYGHNNPEEDLTAFSDAG
ncbi:hypothetical protein NEHOM01_0004 [Nematocida homosporus]|uniref:uncharacterized protein n=1 Tax=Nematocida homosporus TaxID=1912981 RepID=UPI00221EDBED|nr:uncharacterized protein NEHOM01_0004 [Nematocida homosporus]KAI5184259.1 hypothetical protein NEHOM01_0004 [Nematocida homosporus]